jgi:hypothetical protein
MTDRIVAAHETRRFRDKGLCGVEEFAPGCTREPTTFVLYDLEPRWLARVHRHAGARRRSRRRRFARGRVRVTACRGRFGAHGVDSDPRHTPQGRSAPTSCCSSSLVASTTAMWRAGDHHHPERVQLTSARRPTSMRRRSGPRRRERSGRMLGGSSRSRACVSPRRPHAGVGLPARGSSRRARSRHLCGVEPSDAVRFAVAQGPVRRPSRSPTTFTRPACEVRGTPRR